MQNNDNMVTFMDALLYAMEGEDPSKAIENQERRGQQTVVMYQRLPKKINDHSVPREVRWNGVEDGMEYEKEREIIEHNNIEYTKQQYEKMGITIVEEADDLFWNVNLPEGWVIKATDHSMWNNLFDDKGRKRANFFYKAAFYDRDAFINFDTRFSVSVSHTAAPGTEYKEWVKSDYQGTVKDGETIIFATECVAPSDDYEKDEKIQNSLFEQLEKFMQDNYPDYKDINAYWD